MADGLAEYKVTFPDGKEFKVTAPEGLPQSQVISIARQSQLSNRISGTGIEAIDQPISNINEMIVGIPEGISNLTSAISDPIVEAGLNLLGPNLGTQSRQAAEEKRKSAFDAYSRATSPYASPYARTTGQVLGTVPLALLKLPSAVSTALPRIAPFVERGLQGALGSLAVPSEDMSKGESMLWGAGINAALPPALQLLARTKPAQYLASGLSRAVAPVTSLLDRGAESARSALGIAGREAVDFAKAASEIPNEFEQAFNSFISSRGPNITWNEVKSTFDDLARQFGVKATITNTEAKRFAEAAQKGAPFGGVKQPLTESIPPVQEALGPEAAQRLRNFQRIGVTAPTTGMVTREPGVWQYERNTMNERNLGEPIRDAINKVNDEIRVAADNLTRKVGSAVDAEKVGAQAAAALRQKEKDMQTVVGQLYRNAREKYGEKSAGPVQNFLEQLDNPDLVDDAAFDTFRSSIFNRLGRYGMLGESGLPRNGAVMTVGQAEEMRRFIRGLGNGADPNVQRIRGLLIDSLDDDVVAGFGDDAFKTARDAAKQRFAQFKDTLAGKIAEEGGVASERVTERLLSKSTSVADLRSLKSTLLSGDKDQIARGQQAWSGIGAQALTDLFTKARTGENIISGIRLRDAFEANQLKLKEILSREDFVTLSRIVKAAKNANIPVDFSGVNTSNTAAGLANLFAEQGQSGRSYIKNLLSHVAGYIAGGPAANIAIAGASEVSRASAAQQAANLARRQVGLATNPVAAAEQMTVSAFPQAQRPPAQGFTTPGIIQALIGGNEQNQEYRGQWVMNPQTKKMEWIPY